MPITTQRCNFLSWRTFKLKTQCSALLVKLTADLVKRYKDKLPSDASVTYDACYIINIFKVNQNLRESLGLTYYQVKSQKEWKVE